MTVHLGPQSRKVPQSIGVHGTPSYWKEQGEGGIDRLSQLSYQSAISIAFMTVCTQPKPEGNLNHLVWLVSLQLEVPKFCRTLYLYILLGPFHAWGPRHFITVQHSAISIPFITVSVGPPSLKRPLLLVWQGPIWCRGPTHSDIYGTDSAVCCMVMMVCLKPSIFLCD